MKKRPVRRPSVALVVQDPARRLAQVIDAAPMNPLSTEPMMLAACIGTLTLSEAQISCLRRPVNFEEIDWKPVERDGPPILPYLSHNGYRDRLDAAFGLGGWGMLQIGVHRRDGDFVYIPFALIIGGVPRVYAWGEQQIHKMTLGDALEGAKSNAIVRCGKELGIARELWNKKHLAKLQAQRQAYGRGPHPVAADFAAPVPEAPAPPDRGPAPSTLKISEPQRKRFFAIARRANRTKPELMVWLLARWGVGSTADITRDIYNTVIAEVERPGPLRVPEVPDEAPEPGSYDGD